MDCLDAKSRPITNNNQKTQAAKSSYYLHKYRKYLFWSIIVLCAAAVKLRTSFPVMERKWFECAVWVKQGCAHPFSYP